MSTLSVVNTGESLSEKICVESEVDGGGDRKEENEGEKDNGIQAATQESNSGVGVVSVSSSEGVTFVTEVRASNEADTGEEEPENGRKLFIGGLNRATTDESLTAFYRHFGETTHAAVMKDPNNQQSRGFAFVTYKRQSMVDTAMANRPHVIDGKTVDPKRAVPREEGNRGEKNISSKRLYVANVREELDEQSLRQYFAQFGNVEKVDIILDKITNKPRGFAFVTFDDYDPVDKCIIQKFHHINGHRCEVKKGLNKEEQLRAQVNKDRLERSIRSRGMERGGRGGYAGYGQTGGYAYGYGRGYPQGGYDPVAYGAYGYSASGRAGFGDGGMGGWGQGNVGWGVENGGGGWNHYPNAGAYGQTGQTNKSQSTVTVPPKKKEGEGW